MEHGNGVILSEVDSGVADDGEETNSGFAYPTIHYTDVIYEFSVVFYVRASVVNVYHVVWVREPKRNLKTVLLHPIVYHFLAAVPRNAKRLLQILSRFGGDTFDEDGGHVVGASRVFRFL